MSMIIGLPFLAIAKNVYLATYFVGNGESGAYLAVSTDGYKFEPIVEPNVPILKPSVGKDKLMRDPCLLRGADGSWHMVWTSGWWDQGLGMSHSKDLVHWDEQKNVPVMEGIEGTLNTWAPEITYDPKLEQYVIFWSSTVRGQYPETSRADGDKSPNGVPLNHRFYATTTSDFATYTPAAPMWDPGFNCIDATLLRDGTRWVLFAKDETKAPKPAKFLFVAAGPRPLGSFVTLSDRITGAFWAEGPTAVKDKDTYRVYFDRYTEGRWGAVESKDLVNWTDVSDQVRMVPGARHGTIQMVPEGVVEKVRKALVAG